MTDEPEQPVRRFQTPTGLWWEYFERPLAFEFADLGPVTVDQAMRYAQARYLRTLLYGIKYAGQM